MTIDYKATYDVVLEYSSYKYGNSVCILASGYEHKAIAQAVASVVTDKIVSVLCGERFENEFVLGGPIYSHLHDFGFDYIKKLIRIDPESFRVFVKSYETNTVKCSFNSNKDAKEFLLFLSQIPGIDHSVKWDKHNITSVTVLYASNAVVREIKLWMLLTLISKNAAEKGE